MPIGNQPAGATFKVVATAASIYKATSATTVRVTARPSLQVTPASGPAGKTIILRGLHWAPNRPISLGMRAAQSTSESWLPNTVATNAGGNFTASLLIGAQYANRSDVYLIAFDPASQTRMEVAYHITAAPAPTATAPAPTATRPPAPTPTP